MTVSGNVNRVQYTGNGSTSIFSTGSIIFYDASDLVVTETVIATGVDTQYTITTDYTVTGGSGSAGSITLVAGNLPTTKRITIERSIPYTQSSDFVEGETILAEEIETSLDKIVIMAQQLNDAAERSVKLPSTTTASGITLPNYSADKLLSWSSSTSDVLVTTSFTANDVQGAIDGVAAAAEGSGVLVSANDAAIGFLNGKLVAGDNITFTENDDGSNESLTISTADNISASTSAGGSLRSSNNDVCISYGAGGSANSTLGGNMSGASTYKLVNMADPTSAQDYVTKAYVDSISNKVVSTHSGVKSTTAVFPYDNTKPQNTEGTEVTELATTITPKSASSLIKVTVFLPFVDTSANRVFMGAIYKDEVADALTSGALTIVNANNPAYFVLTYYEAAATTDARTYKFRYGAHGSGTTYIGRDTTGRTLGDAQYSMIVEEVFQ
jgi:hypothetical protein